jgi:predicted GIY-YIG superfamily endonuclease
VAFLVYDVVSFIANPTWENAAWIAVDAISTAIPTGSISLAARAARVIDETAHAAEIARVVGEGTRIAAKGASEGAHAGAGVAAISKETSDWLSKGPADTHVYYGIKNGEENYVGITKDLEQRYKQHGDRFDFLKQITNTPLTRNQARAVEQALINRNSHFSNKINSISSKRPWYNEAVQWGENWLKIRGY